MSKKDKSSAAATKAEASPASTASEVTQTSSTPAPAAGAEAGKVPAPAASEVVANNQVNAPTPPETKLKASKTIPAITVTAPNNGYRRAGLHWTRGRITVPLKDLSKAQLQTLRADPHLKVKDTEIEVES